jgi:hypothetical protein
MKQRQIGRAATLIFGLLAMGFWHPAAAWSQEQPSLQQVEKQLQEKRIAAEAHQQQMQGIKDPEQLSVETRRHFRMTEDILALMLERRKLMEVQAVTTGSTPERGAPGGHLERHAQGSTPGSSMAEQPPASGPERGAPGGHLQRHDKNPGQGSGMPGSETPGPQAGTPQRGAPGGHLQRHDQPPGQGSELEAMKQMLQQITEHSAYMDTLQDRAVLAQEMLQHQKMLDQMLVRLQQ